MNKKASVQDVGWAMIFFFTAVVLFLVVTYSYGAVVDKIKLNPAINSSAVTIASFEDSKSLTSRYDYVSVAILMGFILAIIISGWLVGGHPIFSILYFIFLIVIVMTSYILAFVWNKISTTALLSATVAAKFPISSHILNNFPTYITVIGFIGMIVMFAKPRQEQY